jgi:hypothetical protein
MADLMFGAKKLVGKNSPYEQGVHPEYAEKVESVQNRFKTAKILQARYL